MRKNKSIKKLIIIFFLLIIFIWAIPNLFNSREKEFFSDDSRLERSKNLSVNNKSSDSIRIVPGEYYQKSSLHEWLFGISYRGIWQVAVKVPILDLTEDKGGLEPFTFSGSQQTIGIDAKDKKGRIWSIRSSNKDQAKALPPLLQTTFLRSLFRDQAAALNPYGALVVPVLANAIGIHHTNPEIYYFPFNESNGEYNQRMAGRLVLLEEEADESWAGSPEFNFAIDLMDSERMLEMAKNDKIPVDTLMYARSRILDMLISDWDRHEGNWKWALIDTNGQKWLQPIPVDRDMAFYNFSEGKVNQIALMFNNKFQSFRSEFDDVAGLAVQAAVLDKYILRNLTKEELLNEVQSIQKQLSQEIIEKAFGKYPPEVHSIIGREHEAIFKSRLNALPNAINEFHEHLNNK